MIAAEVSHDILAAFIGGVALIVVATLPILWKQVLNTRRQDVADLLAVQERIDLVLRRMDEMQERRAIEHADLRERMDAVEAACVPNGKPLARRRT